MRRRRLGPLVFLVLTLASARTAFAAERIEIAAAVDRIEEAWLVLDVPPHPSLNVPLRLGPSLREGDRVRVIVERRFDGAWHVARTSGREPRVTLSDGLGTFRWPRALAPPLEAGDHVGFRIVPAPASESRLPAAH